MPSKQEIGNQYRARTMQMVARMGYATTRQISMAVFAGTDVTSKKMAGRTIRRLRQDGYLVEKRVGDTVAGELMIALNRRGAQAVSAIAELPGGKSHARDWLRHSHAHRTACNSVFAAYCQGLYFDCGWTELEVRAGLAPPTLCSFGFKCDGESFRKIPDLVLAEEEGDVWVEVENNWRSSTDFLKVVSFLRAMFSLTQPPCSKVRFIITAAGAKSIGRRLRDALTHAADSGWPRQIKELDRRLLEKHIEVLHLDVETLRLSRVHF